MLVGIHHPTPTRFQKQSKPNHKPSLCELAGTEHESNGQSHAILVAKRAVRCTFVAKGVVLLPPAVISLSFQAGEQGSPARKSSI